MHPGSVIITDCWKGYVSLDKAQWSHLTVYHFCNFVDPETGAHTQSIESMWSHLKRSLNLIHRSDNLMLHFGYYLFKRRFTSGLTIGERHFLFNRHVGLIYIIFYFVVLVYSSWVVRFILYFI